MASIPIIEVIGLPGVGKTNACKALLKRLDGAERSTVSVHATKLRRSFAPKIALPVTLLRYRRLITALTPNPGPNWARTRAVGHLLRWRGGKLWRSKDPLVSTVFMLAVTIAELALARLEARLRRRTLIIDEGFVHRALGIWTRSAPEIRDETMAAYIETIPSGSRCILLRCEPETALARALTRTRGIPTATIRAARALVPSASGDDAAVAVVYAEHAGVFDHESLRSRVEIREVDAAGTPEEIAEQIAAALKLFGAEHRALIFLRTSPHSSTTTKADRRKAARSKARALR